MASIDVAVKQGRTDIKPRKEPQVHPFPRKISVFLFHGEMKNQRNACKCLISDKLDLVLE